LERKVDHMPADRTVALDGDGVEASAAHHQGGRSDVSS